MDAQIITVLVGAIVGGFLSAGAGYCASLLLRRKEAFDRFVAEVTSAVYQPVTQSFVEESSAQLRQALMRLRPFISRRRFIEGLRLTDEYRTAKPFGYEPWTLTHKALCVRHGVDQKAWAYDISERLVETVISASLNEIERVI